MAVDLFHYIYITVCEDSDIFLIQDNKDANNNNAKVVLELDWLALGVAAKYQLLLDNSPQSTLMWKSIKH